jgi:hypothetical protein
MMMKVMYYNCDEKKALSNDAHANTPAAFKLMGSIMCVSMYCACGMTQGICIYAHGCSEFGACIPKICKLRHADTVNKTYIRNRTSLEFLIQCSDLLARS